MFSFLKPDREKLRAAFFAEVNEGRFSDAIKVARRIHKHFPEEYQVMHDLGSVYLAMQLPDDVIMCFESANHYHECSMHWNNLGRAYQQKQEFGTAMEAYDKAIEMDPADARPPYNRTVCFREMGDMDSAFDALKEVIEGHPEHLGAHSDLALHYAERGDVDAAIELLEKALEIDSDHSQSRQNLVTVLIDDGQLERAREVLEYVKRRGQRVEIETKGGEVCVRINGSIIYKK